MRPKLEACAVQQPKKAASGGTRKGSDISCLEKVFGVFRNLKVADTGCAHGIWFWLVWALHFSHLSNAAAGSESVQELKISVHWQQKRSMCLA